MKYNFQSSTEIVAVLQGMNPEVRGLFDQVETVARLLLVVPVSSSESERSFSSLQRLKTWLRSTMTQTRLNSVAVCYVHKDKLDRVNRKKIAEQFVSCKEAERALLVLLNERKLVICSLVSCLLLLVAFIYVYICNVYVIFCS